MAYPDLFYILKVTSRERCQETPTGNINVNELLKHNPYWVAPNLSTEKQPKKLILAEWGARNWSDKKITAVINELNQLIKAGFSISLWHSGKLVPLTKDNLSLLKDKEVRNAINPAFLEEMLATDKHFLKDETHILDNYWLSFLSKKNAFEKRTKDRTLRITDYNSLMYDEYQKAHDILQQSIPPLRRLIVDEFGDKASDSIDKLQEMFPHLEIIPQYRSMNVYAGDLEKLFQDQVIELNQYRLTQSDLPKVSMLTVVVDYSDPSKGLLSLQIFLKTNPQLTSLNIRANIDIFSNFLSLDLSGSNLPNLENLTFGAESSGGYESINSLSTVNLLSYLSVAPALKVLDLSIVEELEGNIDLVLNHVEHLIELQLPNKMPLSSLSKLLRAVPNVKKLKLPNLSGMSGEEQAAIFEAIASLSQLEEVDFSANEHPIPASVLKRWITILPIKRLNGISVISKIEAPDVFKIEGKNAYLEKLLFWRSNLAAEEASAIFADIPNLRQLKMNSTEIIGDMQFVENSLLALEEIEARYCSISDANLNVLLEAAPNLKKLTLMNSTKIIGDMQFVENSLLALEEIEASSCSISDANLNILLEAAPNLKKLTLSKVSVPSNLRSRLHDLEYISWKESIITASSLSALFRSAPNLKIINLSSSTLPTSIMLDKSSLLALENLDLSYSNSSSDNLNTLITAAPNLKVLYLYRCQNLDKPLMLDKNSLLRLEKIQLSHSNITTENLKALLIAAPNLKELDISGTHLNLEDKTLQDLLSRINRVTAINKYNYDDNDKDSYDKPDPEHHAESLKAFIPTSEDKAFQFSGKNKTKNQGMIIEKLSQYLTLTQQHLAVIPKLQDGICNALTHLFMDASNQQWDFFMELVSNWNGQQATLSEVLKQWFEALYIYVDNHQFKKGENKFYIGDNLDSFLNALKQPVILNNPWHAIAIRPLSNGQWAMYEPNSFKGVYQVQAHELAAIIRKTQGTLISVESSSEMIEPRIENPSHFLENGGLLALIGSLNWQAMLQQLTPAPSLSAPALDGLFFRDTCGIPAWVSGLLHAPHLATYTYTLLAQFIANNPDYKTKLQNSVAHLPAEKRHEAITAVIDILSSPASLPSSEYTAANRAILIDVLRTTPASPHDYERAFQTWKNPTKHAGSVLEFCQRTLRPLPQSKKRLINVGSKAAVNALQWSLEDYCQNTSRTVFVVNSPADLVCSASFVAYDAQTNTGRVQKGGGALYDFLQAHRNHPSPVLIVNYDNFSATDLVRFNSLLDETRLADSALVPPNTLVVGVINSNKPDCYQGSDFYSRFDEFETCPLKAETLLAAVHNLPIREQTAQAVRAEEKYVINLYQAPDWETILLGNWVLTGNHLHFQEGEFAKALASGKPIELGNAPWQNEAFTQFWDQAYLRGVIQTPGPKLSFPKDTTLLKRDGYDWQALLQGHSVQAGIDSHTTTVLNPNSFSDFFGRYILDGVQIKPLPGLIEAASNTVLSINVTCTISEHEWARLLSACQTHQVRLAVHCAPGAELPPFLSLKLNQANPVTTLPAWSYIANDTTVIISTDLDTTLATVTQDDQPWEIIDISECKPADLLYRLDGQFNESTLSFQFKSQESVLIRLLSEGKRIVLKGALSAELRDALAPLLLQRQQDKAAPGKLVLITDKADGVHFMSPFHHVVTIAEKKAQLGPLSKSLEKHLESFLDKEPLSMLKARCRYSQRAESTGKLQSDKAWAGLTHLEMVFPTFEFNAATSEKEAEAFTQARIDAVNKVLVQEPYVFLTGLSGVGKSTFVEKELLRNQPGQLFVGEASIETWANETAAGQKILFLDEANLSQKQFSEFEGLFNTPPTLFIKGMRHALTPEHKVIFVGNPLSYGDERALAPFFKRHGNALVFSILPPAFLYEKILKPVFKDSLLAPQAEAISRHILAVYHVLCTHSTTDVLITPRELQMMALLVISHHKQHPNDDIMAVTQRITYQLAHHLVPKANQDDFDSNFKPIKPSTQAKRATTSFLGQGERAFIVTPSRQAIVTQLNTLLDLCEQRAAKEFNNDAQYYGGLGGIVMEGEPGIGKSDLLQGLFAARGYQQIHPPYTNLEKKDKAFYVIPASMSLANKEALLRQAFDEGAKVIFDEINSSPMMENLLNHLLMGKTPENKPPAKPGFMIFGTQNPASMAGRRITSPALARRLLTTTLKPYPTEEMKAILIYKGLPKDRAFAMVDAFEKQVQVAHNQRLSPIPSFRNLLNLAKQEIKRLSMVIVSETTSADNLSVTLAEMSHIVQALTNHLAKLLKCQHEVKFTLFGSTPASIIEIEATQVILDWLSGNPGNEVTLTEHQFEALQREPLVTFVNYIPQEYKNNIRIVDPSLLKTGTIF